MRKIKLVDGTIYTVDRCGADGGILSINVVSEKLVDLVPVFADPEKTAIIEHYFDGTETDHVFYKSYTQLVGAGVTNTGTTVFLSQNN